MQIGGLGTNGTAKPGGASNIQGDCIAQTAEIYSPEGEVLASYNSFGGGWTIIPTKAESVFINETSDIYMQAFREARAEMKAAAPADTAAVDIRA